jgi:hypothetical protein
LFFRFAQDVAHIDEGYRLASNQRPRASSSLAGFEVTLIGRFWVIPEADRQRAEKLAAGIPNVQQVLNQIEVRR